jgi:signal transduction histidine kinase
MSYRSIEDPVKLRRVIEAILHLEADLDLPALLSHVIDEARSLTDARYGALGVINEEGSGLVEFLTVGLDREEEERIGPRPTGRGVLGLVIADPRPVRLSRLGSHSESLGFPPNHPPMTSFLGVPIKVRNEVYGNLYLTDKVGSPEFTLDDQALVEALALAAGMAIENHRLHQRVQQVAVFDDRDRMARDLHDTVIQRLYAIGLTLQSMAGAAAAAEMADRLVSVIADIDGTIKQVRSSIYELGLDGDDAGVRASLLKLVRELGPVIGCEVHVSFDGPIDSGIPDKVVEHLLATLREAMINVGRHARATEASATLSVVDGMCRLQIADNGRGLVEADATEGGLGLTNLRRRAEKLQGWLTTETPEAGGTLLTWEVPVGR